MAATQQAAERLAQALPQLLINGEWSDLTIRCGNTSWKVHRVVVCTQSEYFKTACREMAPNAGNSTLDLSTHDIHSIEAMIKHLYNQPYTTTTLDTSSHNHRPHPATFHARVFATAKQFSIPSLQHQASRHFHDTITVTWQSDAFADVVREVYHDTWWKDGLRSIVARVVRAHQFALYRDANSCGRFKEVFPGIPELQVDVLTLGLDEVALERCPDEMGNAVRDDDYDDEGTSVVGAVVPEWYTCPRCGVLFEARIDPSEPYTHACDRRRVRYPAGRGPSNRMWKSEWETWPGQVGVGWETWDECGDVEW